MTKNPERKKIYLACPYTHKKSVVMTQRYRRVTKLAAWLTHQGHIVYSPITHSHPMSRALELPQDTEFWMRIDKHFIEWADEMWVYMLDGYKLSVGIREEIKIAMRLEMPILGIGIDKNGLYSQPKDLYIPEPVKLTGSEDRAKQFKQDFQYLLEQYEAEIEVKDPCPERQGNIEVYIPSKHRGFNMTHESAIFDLL